jgi:predicted O-methyltransferase YrrM
MENILNGTPIFLFDWFSQNIPLWNQILKNYKEKPNLTFLELGVFEGLCTRWLLNNILTDPTSRIYCCDIFDDENYKIKYANIFKHFKNLKIKDIFLNNINIYKNKVKIFEGYTSNILKLPEILQLSFDFVYIDACHESSNVLEDAILSFPLVKKNGIIIFDDYLQQDILSIENPKIGIDSFLNSYKGLYEIINVGYQMIIKKCV